MVGWASTAAGLVLAHSFLAPSVAFASGHLGAVPPRTAATASPITDDKMGPVPRTRQTDKVDQQLTVQWLRKTLNTNPQSVVFQDAQATYDGTTVTADTITVYLQAGNRRAVAEGHVHLVDIDGTLDASRIEFDWVNRTGKVENARLQIQDFMVEAASASFAKNVFTASDVWATPCGGEDTPILEVHAASAIASIGGEARLYHASIYLLGRHVITLKEYALSPNRRGVGLPLPNVGYSKSSGASIGWSPGYLINEQTSITGGFHFQQHERPSEDALLSHSLLPPSIAPGGFIPSSDFGERFGFSYFENIYVLTPELERAFVGNRRESVAVGALYNEGPSARRVGGSFNKPTDLVYENASTVRGFGVYTQFRGQRIDQRGGASDTRLLSMASIQLPTWIIAPRLLYTDVRFDGFAATGEHETYGWGHAQFGLVSRPTPMLRLGLAYTDAAQFGHALFQMDAPYVFRSINFRADLLDGPHKLSVLWKYDPSRGRWYDTEFEISQDVRCFEPYILYRSVPRGYQFGLRLRLDYLVDILRRRTGQGQEHNPEEGEPP